MREVDWWDIIPVAETSTRFEDLYKNEHLGRCARQIDRDLMLVVF
ncbi:hypothetical protein AB0L82_35395 [Nocardia sp. NPDC052001]